MGPLKKLSEKKKIFQSKSKKLLKSSLVSLLEPSKLKASTALRTASKMENTSSLISNLPSLIAKESLLISKSLPQWQLSTLTHGLSPITLEKTSSLMESESSRIPKLPLPTTKLVNSRPWEKTLVMLLPNFFSEELVLNKKLGESLKQPTSKTSIFSEIENT